MWRVEDRRTTQEGEREGTNENCHNFHYDDFYNSSYRCHHHLRCRFSSSTPRCFFFASFHSECISSRHYFTVAITHKFSLKSQNMLREREFRMQAGKNKEKFSNPSHAECFWERFSPPVHKWVVSQRLRVICLALSFPQRIARNLL